MKKKILALLIAVSMMAFLFVGCGNDETTEPEVTETPEVEVTPEVEEEDEEYEEYEEEDEDEEELDEQIEGAPVRGIWDGDIFTSAYLGLQFEKPEGWAVATEEDIMELMGLGAEFIGDDLFGEGVDMTSLLELANVTTIHDMMVSDPLTGTNVQIAYERLIFPANRMTAPEYIETLGGVLETMGMEVNFDFPGTTRIGNYEWYSFESVMDVGIEVFGRYLINVQDGFARTISITYSEMSEPLDDILALFR